MSMRDVKMIDAHPQKREIGFCVDCRFWHWFAKRLWVSSSRYIISRHFITNFKGDRNVQARFLPYFVSYGKNFGRCSCAACNFKIFETQNFHQVPLNRGNKISSLVLPYYVPVLIRVYWTTVFNLETYWTGLESNRIWSHKTLNLTHCATLLTY